MLTVEEVEALRRSHAMAPLSRATVDELLVACAEAARERRAIRDALAELPGSVAELRRALNHLHRIVSDHGEARLSRR